MLHNTARRSMVLTPQQPKYVLRRQNQIYHTYPRRDWRTLQGGSGFASPSKQLAPQIRSALLSFQVLCSPSSRSLHCRQHTVTCTVSCKRRLSASYGCHCDGPTRLRTWYWRLHVWWSRSDAELSQYGKCHRALFPLVCLAFFALACSTPFVHVQWLRLDCWTV